MCLEMTSEMPIYSYMGQYLMLKKSHYILFNISVTIEYPLRQGVT